MYKRQVFAPFIGFFLTEENYAQFAPFLAYVILFSMASAIALRMEHHEKEGIDEDDDGEIDKSESQRMAERWRVAYFISDQVEG